MKPNDFSTDDLFSDEQLKEVWRKGFMWVGRIVRGISYFVIALLLLRVNTYGLYGGIYLAIAIGLLGAGSSSARVAQMAIFIMLLMAVLPLSMLSMIRSAIN